MSAVRRVARVVGVVQGVGFRPSVARLAAALDLAGCVRNDGAEVAIEVEGPPAAVLAFEERLLGSLPPAARVEAVAWADAAPVGASTFVIAASEAGGRPRVAIPPDLVTCAECAAEVVAPGRRQGYPFTNCTACGPRYTLVASLPYDRAATAMAGFPLCAACAAEYGDPRDRRYHAEPIACPACGPRCWLRDREGLLAAGDDAVRRARNALRARRILGVKGLGGWQLLVDATDEGAVARLRERKRREAKPFAVLVADLAAARALAGIDAVEAAALASPAGPIVLLRGRGAGIARGVAPGLDRIGLMLPTTPLHHLLVAGLGVPVVCTSGNLSEEPIAIGDGEAVERLGTVADLLLGHDRPILRRCDDAVAQVVDGAPRTLRLGRGLGPATLPLAPGPDLLAVGAHLKCAPAAASGSEAVLWPHVGDLDGHRAREALRASLDEVARFLGLRPTAIVHDAHPDYGSTRVAEGTGLPRMAVGHHHAHVASALAEHGLEGALGFAWDGTGLGDDGAAWGGEALRVDASGARRVAWLRPFPLPGGDAAARDGRRALAGALVEAGLRVPASLERQADLARGPLATRTTSVGRLFDAVAALLGIRDRSRFEGEAAMALEQVARGPAEPYPFRLEGPVVDWRPALAGVARDRHDAPRAAAAFHATLTAAIVAVVARERAPTVVLTGGCFQNARLAEATLAALRERGVDARLPARAPPGDGGLSLGQLWVARHRLGRP